MINLFVDIMQNMEIEKRETELLFKEKDKEIMELREMLKGNFN